MGECKCCPSLPEMVAVVGLLQGKQILLRGTQGKDKWCCHRLKHGKCLLDKK